MRRSFLLVMIRSLAQAVIPQFSQFSFPVLRPAAPDLALLVFLAIYSLL